ncbi:MAG: DUF4167 domain-containing protein [Pseudomonadota bacterium]
MRSSNKSRSRNKNNNRNRSVGNVVNRVFDSAGPEGKVRGTPQQIIEKYQALARDAQLSNDRVAAENFMQHSEHYTRLLGEAVREQAERQQEQAERQAQEAQARNANQQQSGQNGTQPARKEAPQDPGAGNQPEAAAMAPVELPAEGEGPDLVETPENAQPAPPPKKPRSRTRRSAKPAQTEAETEAKAPQDSPAAE